MKDNELVSIGMPIYNAEKFLRRAIDSLLAQTYDNLEIIISDNASLDGTEAICREYQKYCSRIKYFRQHVNIGAARNFNFVIEVAVGDYFMFAAHDDYWAPGFVEKNKANLERNKDCVMSCSETVFVKDGRFDRKSDGTRAIRGQVESRLRNYLIHPSDNSRYYGVFKRSVLLGVYQESYWKEFHGLDWYQMALTLLKGGHCCVEEVLFYREAPEKLRYINSVKSDNRLTFFERQFPMLPMSIALWRRLSQSQRRAVAKNLVLLNLRMFVHHAYVPFFQKIRSFVQ